MKSPHSRTQHRHAHTPHHEDTTHGTGHRGWVIQLSQTFWWGPWERRAPVLGGEEGQGRLAQSRW